jgi:hypothetical protein
MSKGNSDRPKKKPYRGYDDMDGGQIGGRLNSDNSFSDTGLNNEILTSEAVKRTDS